MNDITLYKGNYEEIPITVTDSDGEIFDLTGYDMVFTVKSDLDNADADAEIQKSCSIDEPTNGHAELVLEISDTSDITPGGYYYDIVITNAETSDRRTIVFGRFILEPVVNQV